MAVNNAVPRKLWEHPDPKSTPMYRFMQDVNRRHGLKLKTFWDLHAYSIKHKSQFYAELFDAANFIHSGRYDRVVDESLPIDRVPRWFEGVRLNFAENMLYTRSLPASKSAGATTTTTTSRRGTQNKDDARIAVTEIREGGSATQHVNWADLRNRVGRLAAALRRAGVREGDRVVVIGANSVHTLLVFLATCWLGAIFSSSSTDMGVQGILQRTVQVNPKLLFMDDAAVYNGKTTDLRDKMAEVVAGLAGCTDFHGAVAIPRFPIPRDVSRISKTESLETFLSHVTNEADPEFVRIPFHAPFMICYSSGTTGQPKAIVHSAGGVMLNYFKEGVLHEGIGPDTVSLQFTTVGWIMYVANTFGLLWGARCVFYDGSPFVPDAMTLIRIMGEQRVTKLGTSPRWMLELKNRGIVPRKIADLSALRTVTSTGMVLSDELFEWFYDVAFPKQVHLANISGGTDIAGGFAVMNPLTPVYVGGTQGPILGVDVKVFDALLPSGEPGKELPHGQPGELVATSSFPNIPVFFWGDKHSPETTAPPGSRYHSSYFARFPHVWAHGDFICIHPVTGNVVFLGRADGVLNPSGIRFGSAEIYGVIERRFADRVADSLCVGQRRPKDQDEAVMLFLLMKKGNRFDQKLAKDIREAIRSDLSKRHVPKWIFETPDIPATVNGKKVELPVKQIISGNTIKPSGTLANPQSLDYYYQFQRVEELAEPRAKL